MRELPYLREFNAPLNLMRNPIKKKFYGECNAQLWNGKFKFYFTQQWMYIKPIQIPVIT